MSRQPDQSSPRDPRPQKAGDRIDEAIRRRAERRRERLHAGIRRERAGGHTVPTWVLAVVLAAILIGWLYLIVAG